MTIIIAGSVRLPADAAETLRQEQPAVMAATRAEPGCITYTLATDAEDPGLLRVFEVWRDEAALHAHIQAPHMAKLAKIFGALPPGAQQMSLYEVSSSRPL